MQEDVFVSYSSKNKAAADAVIACFDEAKITCWAAPRNIVPGADWGGAIIDGIKGARVMVVVFSEQSNASQQVLREIERAVNRGIPIIPFKIDNSMPSGSMEYFLSTPHWLDATSGPMEAHLKRLRETVLYLLKAADAPAQLPPPVPIWRRYLMAIMAMGAVLLFGAAWYLYRLSLPVDTALIGTWKGQDRYMIGTADTVDDRITIGSDGSYLRVSRYQLSGSYTRPDASSFDTGKDIKGVVENGQLSTRTCCFFANTLPNYSASLPTANMGSTKFQQQSALLWRQSPGKNGQVWTTTWETYGIPWVMTLTLSSDGRFALDAKATVKGTVHAKNAAFRLSGPNGYSQSSTYDMRGGDVLFLSGLSGGSWVRHSGD